MTDYKKKALDFAKKHGITLKVVSSRYGLHFPDDKMCRYVFKMRLERTVYGVKRRYTFDFGQSIAAGNKEPHMYDVLSCITKYDPYSFEDFCANYGYDEDSRSAYKTYLACCREYEAVERLFGDILEELQNID